ncbi:hypothetical protein CASFOL_013564 [Castilleja foliolosa]|uniref:DUF7138 domain-containing protein n=1 Tax=Castilleja foliolosa TaxID=1961234 RepID=A0ABD3DLJ7_9LAMI
MVEGRRSVPVVFFDGEMEMNIGDVKISPTLEYKPFQIMLSQKIGISPNQISIYLIDLTRNPDSTFRGNRRRIPITGKVNFSLICLQRDCCFLVVLKRPRRSRIRRERTFQGPDLPYLLPDSNFSLPPLVPLTPENMFLMSTNYQVPLYDHITQPGLEYLNNRLRVQSENDQMAMVKANCDSVAPGTMMTNNGSGKVFCEECDNAARDGDTTSFHPCVNDTVITGFTPKFGPIKRIEFDR